MTQQWHFHQDDQAQWRWKRLDAGEGEVDSDAGFVSQTACMMDAVRYAVQRRRFQSDISKVGLLQ